jgi:phage major head subunit gpT-like protein
MAITNTKVFGKHLDGDISKIFFDEYVEAPSEFDKIAKVSQAPAGNHYTEAELSPLGVLHEIPEGTGVTFDIPEEGHEKTVYYTKYGLGFQITEEMMKDDLFRNFEKMPQKLAKSAAYKRETVFWDLFNSGFGTHTSWDSQYVFDTDHVTLKSATTIANEPSTASSLSETSLQAAFEYFDTLVDEAGMPLDFDGPKTLVVPTELRYTAHKLMGTLTKLGSANNDLNVMAPGNDYVSYSLHVSRFLTSSTAWFLLSPMHDFRFLWKDQASLESADDFYTGNALFKVTMRFCTAVFDYKGAYGNEGS